MADWLLDDDMMRGLRDLLNERRAFAATGTSGGTTPSRSPHVNVARMVAIKLTSSAAGQGKYTASLLDPPTADVSASGTAAESDAGTVNATASVLAVNLREIAGGGTPIDTSVAEDCLHVGIVRRFQSDGKLIVLFDAAGSCDADAMATELDGSGEDADTDDWEYDPAAGNVTVNVQTRTYYDPDSGELSMFQRVHTYECGRLVAVGEETKTVIDTAGEC
jgi:hypothetical protein